MINEIGELRASDRSILLKMWEVSVPSGTRPLVKHSHIRFEIAMIKEGLGEYTVGNKLYEMYPGDFFLREMNSIVLLM